MNVIDLINSLEDVILEGQVPLVKTKSIVNIDEVLDMLDEIKKMLPQELQAANHLRAEKNRLIIEAQQEAQNLIADVAKEADKLVMESDISQRAYIRSKEIIAESKLEANELKRGTYSYLVEKMDELTEKMSQISDEIAQSRQELDTYFADVNVSQEIDYETEIDE